MLTAVVVSQLLALSQGQCAGMPPCRASYTWDSGKVGDCIAKQGGCRGGEPLPCVCTRWITSKVTDHVHLPHVISLSYAPPGDISQVAYVSAGGRGSRSAVLGLSSNAAFIAASGSSGEYETTSVAGVSVSTHSIAATNHMTPGNGAGNSNFSHENDEFYFWVNAVATVTETADSAGGKYTKVVWSSDDSLAAECGSRAGEPVVWKVSASDLQKPPPNAGCTTAILDDLKNKSTLWWADADVLRLETLALDPWFRWGGEPPFGIAPGTLGTNWSEKDIQEVNERFQRPCEPVSKDNLCCASLSSPGTCAAADADAKPMGPVYIDGAIDTKYAVRSTCAEKVGGTFRALDLQKSTARRFISGGKEYGYGFASLATDSTCRAFGFSRTLATSTTGCWIWADAYVDRMFGTVVYVPTDWDARCGEPPP